MVCSAMLCYAIVYRHSYRKQMLHCARIVFGFVKTLQSLQIIINYGIPNLDPFVATRRAHGLTPCVRSVDNRC